MKRREFFTKVVLGTAAVAVCPHILGQEPVKALNPYRNVLSNPYYQWVRAKRSDVHVRDNNYWENLKPTTAFYKDAEKTVQYKNIHKQDWQVSGAGFQYDWVYEGTWPIYFGPVTPQAMDGYQKQWMNIEDYDFFRQLSDLNGVSLFDFSEHRLLGVGLIPGLINPINPGRAFYKAPQYIQDGINRRTISPIDAYEIHIIYQKIK